MRGPGGIVIASCAAVLALSAAGCGGDAKGQDANEPEGTYEVEVVRADFAGQQSVAQSSKLAIEVRNAGDEPIPNVAVSITNGEGEAAQAFGERSDQPGLADSSRPIWIVDSAPRGGGTAYANTWALGALEAGGTRTFTWRVTAVKPGFHTLKYAVAAGLDGKAVAKLAGGGPVGGQFSVRVKDDPPQSRVDERGRVVRE